MLTQCGGGVHLPSKGPRPWGGTLPDPATGEPADFYCLPLGENPTAYDSYLVRVRDVLPSEEL